MSFFTLAKAPTALGRYRVLSPLAGVRVSPICLGAMSIGDEWDKIGMGAMNKESSFKLLDGFYERGGNFIDTANIYQNESSERFIGEWMESRGIRDQIVLATKYTASYKVQDPSINVKVNYSGTNAKSLYVSVEESLKKLRTSYIDLLYVHWWDWGTSVEEVMNALHQLVQSRMVLYLGISDTPAWVVSKANTYARLTGKTPFSVYQGRWNVLQRDFEREIIPMARAEGLALCPWGVLAGGKIRTDAEEDARRSTGENGRTLMGGRWERNEDERKMAKVLEKIAGEVGAKTIQAVAIAYVMQRTPYVFPIIGGRKVEHLDANLEALNVALSNEQIAAIENVIPFDLGFPSNFVGKLDAEQDDHRIRTAGETVRWPAAQAIVPSTA
ncbi:unnamed protein product [Peniophora sp. CBMAI 1063]|nr:unnamed protein product [Peniophora sp. CBMAI 1063]